MRGGRFHASPKPNHDKETLPIEQKWKRIEANGYTILDNGDGRTLGIAKDSPVPILTVDGYAFKDFLRTGELAPYEDWRLSSEERAKDLAQRLSIEDMLCETYGEEAAQARMHRSAYRLLLNIFRTGLFENSYLDLETSLRTVGCPEFVEKGYRSQLRSVTMLKNRDHTLPLREGMKLYVPDRFIKSHLDFMSHPVPGSTVVPAGKGALAARFTLVDTPEEADAAVCFVESPISSGYDPEDRKAGGNGYVPVTLQYRPYCAVNAREHSLAGGDPLEADADRGYRGKRNSAANEADLDLVLETKQRMGDKPVVTVITLKNPMVMAELEPSTDALLVEYGVTPRAVVDVLAGAFTPEGLLPVQIPADMDTVERQREDVAFDMERYRDSQGHTYDFGFGMNYDGVIQDERTRRYGKEHHNG